VLAQHASWRWCFFINLPYIYPDTSDNRRTGGFALAILVPFLHLNPKKGIELSEVRKTFDWIGMTLLTSGVVLFLTGLASGGNGLYSWNSSVVLGTLIPGIVCLIAGSVNEIYTQRNALLPPRLFKNRTTASILTCVFLHGFVYTGGIYYMPLYFQAVHGASATMSGVDLLPASALAGFTAVVTGFIVAKSGDYRWTLWICWTILTLGINPLLRFVDST